MTYGLDFTVRLIDRSPELCFKFDKATIYYKGRFKMDFTIPNGYEVPFILPTGGTDASGNATTLKTPPTCRVSDTAILRLTQPDPATPDNPASGVLASIGPIGPAQFFVEDNDEGVPIPSIIVNVDVIAGDTASLAPIQFGDLRKTTSA